MTSPTELARWDALLERDAAGEPLIADERAFIADYAARNPEAAEELELLRALSTALQRAPLPELAGDQQLIGRVFEQGRAEQRAKRRRGSLAIGLALAAAVALWWARPHLVPPVEQARAFSATMKLTAPAAGVALDGEVAVAETPVRQGQRIETHAAGACFQFDRNARACLGPHSVVRVASLGATVLLSLEQGVVAAELEHQVTGAAFGLQTGSVVVRAVGTRFGLEISAGSFLNVSSGVVEVSGDGPLYRVRAPSRTELGTHRILPLTISDQQALDQVLNPARVVPAPATRDAEPTPSSAAAEPAVVRSKSVVAPPSASAGAATAGELLARARTERAAGAMQDAAKSYRHLIGEYPNSAEALTARVALGQLELSAFGNASAALGHFSEYLRRGGPLEQEARYGQVRALSALGRTAEEKQAIEGFLGKYPKAMQSPALQERLKALARLR